MIPEIDSPGNARIKHLVKLQKSNYRKQHKQLLIEGNRALSRALEAGHALKEIYLCPEFHNSTGRKQLYQQLISLGVPCFHLSRAAFEKASQRGGVDGFLAIADPIHAGLDALKIDTNSVVLVCDRIEKPGNLGAMLRSADAAGIDAIIASDAVVDWSNPNVIHNSVGSIFAAQVATGRFEAVLTFLREHRISIIVADPGADEDYWQADFSGGLAIVVGSEAWGVDSRWQDVATQIVRIPMYGAADSLNAATSATLMMYETARQRRSC